MLRGHYGYYGRPHNCPALGDFLQEVRRIWFACLKRRSQKNRRMGWAEFEALTGSLPSAHTSDHAPLGATCSLPRIILGKSRVRESRPPDP